MLTNTQLELLNRKLTEILSYNKLKVISDTELQVGDRIIVFSSEDQQNRTINSRTITSR